MYDPFIELFQWLTARPIKPEVQPSVGQIGAALL